jgi:hypothetical protein
MMKIAPQLLKRMDDFLAESALQHKNQRKHQKLISYA